MFNLLKLRKLTLLRLRQAYFTQAKVISAYLHYQMKSTAIIIMICGDRIRKNMVTGYTVA